MPPPGGNFFLIIILEKNSTKDVEFDFKMACILAFFSNFMNINIIIIIIYHDFLPTPRRGSHVKSGKTHTQSSRYTP